MSIVLPSVAAYKLYVMAYNPRDFYFKKAKEQNFAARSIFKLEELDKKFRIIRSGDKILDLGCAPGSWSQYCSAKVGPKGIVLAIDLQRVALTLPNVDFVQGDAFSEPTVAALAAKHGIEFFDVVISDMAPKTTGIRITDQQRSYDLCVRALDVARARLKTGGNLVVKFFQSDEFDDYVALLKKHFDRVEMLRPKSTRKNSFEIFIVGVSKKAS